MNGHFRFHVCQVSLLSTPNFLLQVEYYIYNNLKMGDGDGEWGMGGITTADIITNKLMSYNISPTFDIPEVTERS
jgi:hypothetical protein